MLRGSERALALTLLIALIGRPPACAVRPTVEGTALSGYMLQDRYIVGRQAEKRNRVSPEVFRQDNYQARLEG
jgi:hypothetical protein